MADHFRTSGDGTNGQRERVVRGCNIKMGRRQLLEGRPMLSEGCGCTPRGGRKRSLRKLTARIEEEGDSRTVTMKIKHILSFIFI